MNQKLLEAAAGIEPACKGFADLCLTTWLRRLMGSPPRRESPASGGRTSCLRRASRGACEVKPGAENGSRTRDLRLGKPTLCQLSYFRSRGYYTINSAERVVRLAN